MGSSKGGGAGSAAGKAAAGLLQGVVKKSRKSKPVPGAVKPLDVRTYIENKKLEKVGDKLEHDHIPSSAALIRAAEKKRGGPLTKAEKRKIHNEGNTIEVPSSVHAKSDTYRGKNTQAQIDADAADLSAAAKRDYATTRRNLIADGHSPQAVDRALDELRAENKKRGI
ncbi:hypothetical protein AB8O55_09080 [Saccharopolyspora cebuensis]|uniref:Uncharacterized protein n=1 Tax=Saccharopolyspora cebuensis TaxID=418759 RepID=A0ABV4CJG7_9PSEU